MNKDTLATKIFVIEKGKIEETTIGEMDGYIDQTTTPYGIGPRFHVRGTEVWTWGHNGNCPALVEAFETEAEAEARIEEFAVIDFWNCSEFLVFRSRDKAEKFLAANMPD